MTNTLIRFSVLFLLLVAVSDGEAGDLRGKVIDPTGAGIERAFVVLRVVGSKESLQTIGTDEKGGFVFADVASGSYELEVSSPGFVTRTMSAQVMDAQETQIAPVSLAIAAIPLCEREWLGPPTVSCEPIGRQATMLEGRVKEPLNSPLAHVIVSLSKIGREAESLATQTDAKGQFIFRRVMPGLYTLRATHPGYSDFVVKSVEIKSGQRTRIWDSLEMDRCPAGVRCKPTQKVHLQVLCL